MSVFLHEYISIFFHVQICAKLIYEVMHMEEMRKELFILKQLRLKPNYAELARKYHCDWRTVKKYDLGYLGKPKHREKGSALNQYKDIIVEKINKPGATKKAVYEYLKDCHANVGSYSNFSKYILVHQLKTKEITNVPHPRYETPPGKQLQFDWKEDIKMVSKHGELFEFNIFSATLSNSRFHIFRYSKYKTREDVERCLIETFKYIQGKTEEILTDNMSSIVNHTTKTFNKDFLNFCKDVDVKARHCKPKSPETKGKVESSNRFVNWLIPYNHEFEDEAELIEIIENINKKVNQEVNDTTGVTPLMLFEKEKEYLKPLPYKEILEQYLNDTKVVKVPSSFLIPYKGSQYSVPPKFINKDVKLKELNNKLYVYYSENLIACHELSENKINYIKEHYSEGMSYWLKHFSNDEINEVVENNLKALENLNKGVLR